MLQEAPSLLYKLLQREMELFSYLDHENMK